MGLINFEIKQQEERIVTNMVDYVLVKNKTLLTGYSSALKRFKNKYLLILPLAEGVKRNHIKLSVKGNNLNVGANIKPGGFFSSSKPSNSFFRSLTLPEDVEEKLISYEVKNSLLFVSMPRNILKDPVQGPFLYILNLLKVKLSFFSLLMPI